MVRRDMNYWLDIAYRRRTTLIEVASAVMGVVVLITLAWPPVYKSHAKILVQDNRAQLLVSPGLQTASPENPAIVANPVSEQDLNSEVQLLTSLYLVKRAIAGLKEPPNDSAAHAVTSILGDALDVPALGYRSLHGVPALDPNDQWALKLARRLQAYVVNRSNVIDVEFESHDSQWSRAFLRRLIDQYLAYHARISHDPQAAAFFSKQTRLLNAQLNQSENKLRAFELQTGITNLGDQKQALVNRLSDLQLQYSKSVADLASANRQAAQLRIELANTPARIPGKVRSVQNLALQQLKPQVMELKAKRAELLTRYQPTSRRIQEIDAKLAAAEAVLDREDHLVVQEKSTDLNPVWVSVDTNFKQAETSAASLKARTDALGQQISATRKQLADLINSGLEIERLERGVTAKKEAYLSYLRKAEEARAAEGLNSEQILDVSVAQAPNLPLQPAFPIVWLNLLVGTILALAAGFAAACLRERADPRLYSAVSIAQASGLSTVAVLREAQ